MSLSRTELIGKLMWNEGGYGFGIPSLANSMAWGLATTGPDRPDLPSVVAVSGPPEKYSDDELAELTAFSERRTKHYDSYFKQRLGANLIVIDKLSDNSWLRKRMSWESGPMYSTTLKDAVAVFETEQV
ncbi:MAG: hypothetical protein ABA06_02875 [Parcubacteria bacterium C7867-001]|nr:MAG: hypothetical protein ABA06_02875 [Parcubacteria bacterium C7867-001]